LNAIHKVLCKNREIPLMIGSVNSNLGHAETARGFIQIAKVKQVYFAFIYHFYLNLLLLLLSWISQTNKELLYVKFLK